MSTDIAVIDITNPLQVFSTPKGLDAVIDKIEAEVRAIDRDISTAKGRDNIRSIAAKLAKSKTALDKMGKELTEEQRAIVTSVNTERARAWDRMQALQDDIRKPLTDWENAEKERVGKHEARLTEIEQFPVFMGEPSSSAVQQRIDGLKNFEGIEWEEFKDRAEKLLIIVAKSLSDILVSARKRESDVAELESLRAAEQARLRAEREAKIAENARVEAERLAQETAAKLAAQVKEDAEAAAQRERAAHERADKAESLRVEAEKQSELDKAAAVELAALAERSRIAAEQEAERKAVAAREADIEHKKKINNAALVPILAVIHAVQSDEFTADEAAKKLIVMIVKGEIPNVKIMY